MFTSLFVIVHVISSTIAIIEYPQEQIFEQWRDIVSKDLRKHKSFTDAETNFLRLTRSPEYTFPKNTESINVFEFHVALNKALKKSRIGPQINLEEITELVNSGKLSPQVFEVIAEMAGVKYEIKSAGDKKTYEVKSNETKKGENALRKGIMLYTFLGRHALSAKVNVDREIETIKAKISNVQRNKNLGNDNAKYSNELSNQKQVLEDVEKVVAIADYKIEELWQELSYVITISYI